MNPIPRILIQPYAVAGFGYRKLSFEENNFDESWKKTVPLGVGVDIPLGDNGYVLGVELVDYLSNFSSGGDIRHDAFMLGTIGIPLD